MSSKSSEKDSSLQLRLPVGNDRERIRAALDAALYLSLAPEGSTQEQATVAHLCDDPAYTVELIVQNLVDAVIINDCYLLVYAIVKPWYSKNSWCLGENLVLRIGPGGNFSLVANTLEHLAEINECPTITVGGALARKPRALVRLYQRHGFVLETGVPQLTKRR